MLTYDEKGLFSFCGRNFYLEVGSPPEKAREEDNHWTARIWIDAMDGPVFDHDLNIELLDEDGAALEAPTVTADGEELSRAVLGLSDFYFEAIPFLQDAGKPAFVRVVLFGHTDTIALLDKYGVDPDNIPAQTRDDTQDGDPKKDGDDGGGLPPGTEPVGDPPGGGQAAQKCCVLHFITPTGNQKTDDTPSKDNTGKITHYRARCMPWTVLAIFDSKGTCTCTCCEYRQLIKGHSHITYWGRVRGRRQRVYTNLLPDTDYMEYQQPLPGGGTATRVKQVPAKAINAARFVEDSKADFRREEGPPIQIFRLPPIRYGHRTEVVKRKAKFKGNDDYPTPCSYWSRDRPVVLLRPQKWKINARLEIDLTFRGQIVDTCNKDAVSKGPNDWTWKVSGRFQPDGTLK